MQKYEYKGETYYYKNGRWLTSSYTSAPLAVVSALNKLVVESENFDEKSLDELKETAKKARDGGNYQLAQKVLLTAMEKAGIEDIPVFLPMLTSNYRQLGMAEKAISLANEYEELYGRRIQSSALWTSIGAAYADLENYGQAKKYADRAYALSGGKGSPELSGLYGRIKSITEK